MDKSQKGLLIGFGLLGACVVVGIFMAATGLVKTERNCGSDWSKCSDNAEVVDQYLQQHHQHTVACKRALADVVKYGAPEYNWVSFGTYLVGNDYPQTGIAKLSDKDVQISNGFGAKIHSRVECWYDMRNKTASIASVTER